MAARKSKGRTVSMQRAREMECRMCKTDLTAKPTTVPNAFDPDAKPGKALRAPERVVMSFQFAGYSPAREPITIPLCPVCANRVTFTCTGVPLMIDPERQAIEAQGKATEAEKRQAALIAELQGVLARFGK